MAVYRVTKDVRDENIFLNILITNPVTSTTNIPCAITETLQSPVVNNPSDHNLIISRISIPGDSIPIFRFLTRGYPLSTDPNEGIYSVVISYNGFNTPPVYLEYIPQVFFPPAIPVFSATQPQQDYNDSYYDIYSYQLLADMVTEAIQGALTLGASFLPAGVNAYMIYTANTGFFSILGTQNMYHSIVPVDPLNVQIWFNTPLATLLPAFQYGFIGSNTPNGRDCLILVKNNLNNSPTTQDGFNPNIPTGYYQIQTEYNGDSNLQTLSRILLTSNAFGGVVPQSELVSGTSSSYLNVIADFVPAVSVANGSYRSKFQYFSQSEFFRRHLTSSSPLSSISLALYWQDRTSFIHPLILYPGTFCSIQFIFEKKKLIPV